MELSHRDRMVTSIGFSTFGILGIITLTLLFQGNVDQSIASSIACSCVLTISIAYIPPRATMHYKNALRCVKWRFIAIIVAFAVGIYASMQQSSIVPPVIWIGLIPAITSFGFLIFMEILPLFDTWDVTETYPQPGMNGDRWKVTLMQALKMVPQSRTETSDETYLDVMRRFVNATWGRINAEIDMDMVRHYDPTNYDVILTSPPFFTSREYNMFPVGKWDLPVNKENETKNDDTTDKTHIIVENDEFSRSKLPRMKLPGDENG